MRKRIISGLLIAILFIGMIPSVQASESLKYGRSNGIFNDFVTDGSYFYYLEWGNTIIKQSVDGKSKSEIYACDVDYTGDSDTLSDLNYMDGWIYLFRHSVWENTICRIRTDGKGYTRLHTEPGIGSISSVMVVKDKIYYLSTNSFNDNEGSYKGSVSRLMSVNLDGSNPNVIYETSKGYMYSITAGNGYLYIINGFSILCYNISNQTINWINFNGSNIRKVNWSDLQVASDGRLYFLDNPATFDDHPYQNLYSVNTDGSDLRKEKKAYDNCIIVNNALFYYSSDGYIYKKQLDSEQPEIKVSEGVPTDNPRIRNIQHFTYHNGYIYTMYYVDDYVEVVSKFYKCGEPELISPAATGIFFDVGTNSFCYDSVNWAVKQGVTTGKTDTAFAPGETCTNAQILTFLWRAAGKPTTAASNPFSDVNTGNYYYNAALWAYEKGMVSGTEFNASMPCTRSQTVTYLWQAAGKPTASTSSSFTDVGADADYAAAVNWAVEKKITSGTSSTVFSPDATCNRGQIVTFLYRAYSK